MKKYAFPALLTQDEGNSAYIKVSFPDLAGAAAYGTNKQEAISAAEELLLEAIGREKYANVVASSFEKITKKYTQNDVVLIQVEVLSNEEIITKNATKILKKYKKAFEELKDD